MASDLSDELDSKMVAKKYEKELTKWQRGLCMLRQGVVRRGLAAMVIFGARGSAAKGGAMKGCWGRAPPGVFRLVALPARSDREKARMSRQRSMRHFPAAGE